MKFDIDLVDKVLVYVPSWKHIRQELDSLTCIILTLYQSYGPVCVKKVSEVKFIPQNNKEVEDLEGETAYKHHKISPEIISTDCVKSTFKATDQLVSKLLCLPLRSYAKSCFPYMTCPRLTDQNSAAIFFCFSKGIGDHWCDHVLYRKKYLFGTVYEENYSRTKKHLVDGSEFITISLS